MPVPPPCAPGLPTRAAMPHAQALRPCPSPPTPSIAPSCAAAGERTTPHRQDPTCPKPDLIIKPGHRTQANPRARHTAVMGRRAGTAPAADRAAVLAVAGLPMARPARYRLQPGWVVPAGQLELQRDRQYQ